MWRLIFMAAASTASLTLPAFAQQLRIAPFAADITIPVGHRCMGILPTLATTVDDPLEARGFVLSGMEAPIVLLMLDWCEVRNASYDRWRDALASAAGTTRQRVLVSSLHQHDAPVTDAGAQDYLDKVGLSNAMCDGSFELDCIKRVVTAMNESVEQSSLVTHIGTGKALVKGVASSRRVVYPDGRISYDRYSSSGGDTFLMTTDDGPIDPVLRTLSFWNNDQPLLALHAYATHPMSSYGKGAVSSDFVGLARRLRSVDDPAVFQIYASGCSGDVTAGKYNDGSPPMRAMLAERLQAGMQSAWQSTERKPLEAAVVNFECVELTLPFHDGPEFQRSTLMATLEDEAAPERERILAAMSLSSRDRVERAQPIDVPCITIAGAKLLLLPGESFVGYQLRAQELARDDFTMCIGYGECWPGYIPTQQAFDEQFNHDWRWVSQKSPEPMDEVLTTLLREK